MNSQKPTIALFRTGGIGDIILSTVSINIIRDLMPHAEIIWFGREPTISLLKNAYPDLRVFAIDSENSYKKNLSIIRQSTVKLDAIIDLQHSARTYILCRLAASRFKCSYTSWNKYSIERMLLVIQSRLCGRQLKFDLLSRELPNRFEAMALCTMRGLAKMGIQNQDGKKYVPRFESLVEEKDMSCMCICLGAKFLTKALPIQKIKDVVELVIGMKTIRTIHLLGEENQQELADELIATFNIRIELKNFCGTTTLLEAAQILARCAFCVGNDSGLSHLSEAVNTPVLTFFGPTHQKFGYRPFLKRSQTLSVDLGCRPCNKNGDIVCRYGDHACSSQISQSQISTLLSAIYEA